MPPRCGSTASRASSIWGPASWTSAPCWPRIHAGAPPVSGQLDFQLWSEFEGAGSGTPAGLWQQPPDLEGRDQGSRTGLDLGGARSSCVGTGAWQLASHDVIFKLDGATWLHSRCSSSASARASRAMCPPSSRPDCQPEPAGVGLYPELTETLKRTRPRGQLQELVLQADGDWQGLSLQGQLRLRDRAWHDVPGLQKLDNGEFWLTPNGGRPPDPGQRQGDPARHFWEPIPVDSLGAASDWWRAPQAGCVLMARTLPWTTRICASPAGFGLELFEHPFLALTGRIDVRTRPMRIATTPGGDG